MDRNVTLSALAPEQNTVALRKESVDRNALGGWGRGPQGWSLSARRAWIEMTLTVRNVPIDSRRSPQGERG